MKLKSYKEYLKMGKDKVDESLAPIRAMKAKKQAELKIAELDEKIATKEADIFELCSNKDVDFDKIIENQDSLALMERKKKQFVKIIAEMFPE